MWCSDDVPMQGCVFADLRERFVLVDDHLESRPVVEFRFFGLTIDGHLIGNPRCTVLFQPSSAGHVPAIPFVSLSEPGFLEAKLAQRITQVGAHTAQLVSGLLMAVTGEFLTDERVARTRYLAAEQRRAQTTSAHQEAVLREQSARHRAQAAVADAEAAYALLSSVRKHR